MKLEVNDRVKFTGFKVPDPWSKLEAGIEGTVKMITNDGINIPVFVHWDSGSRLSHSYSEVEKIETKCPECGRPSFPTEVKSKNIRTGKVLCDKCFWARPITMVKKYDPERYEEIKEKPYIRRTD